ncbi:MAG: hypothetical protein OCD02_08115 [Spirochaetaceae bacterium]
MKLSTTNYQEVKTWMHLNSRPLEMSIWLCLFENGTKESVISELGHYQNSDGGFGNCLEPDSWNSSSTPYTTYHAISILNKIGFKDYKHPMYQDILKYLGRRSEFTVKNGWNFSVKSNDNAPHAPWWGFDSKSNETENIGLTAELCSFLLDSLGKQDELYILAEELTKGLLSKLDKQTKLGEMAIGGFSSLLDSIKNKNIVHNNTYTLLNKKLASLVTESIEYDISKWAVYGVRPTKYITSPQSIFYEANREILDKELEYLVTTLPKNSVWGITWSWYDNQKKYSKEFAISENWWKAILAIEKIEILNNFGYIEVV